ncbi:DUF305 domain-containing protein [Luteococcus sp. Sow4_B9]|uniref:DUF305 domain-containing protein n=1 Tax=Luteococcus sp. Sow4_B9 TaxID=3438792 RepID=UPI003F9662E4
MKKSLALAAVLALALTGCGQAEEAATEAADKATSAAASAQGSAESSPQASAEESAAAPGQAEHNSADAMFSQMMIVHHEGALEMSELAEEKAGSEEVKALATRIKDAQQPEINTMTDWLKTWNEPLESGHDAHAMPGMDMDGMTQEEVMDKLEGLQGTEFDKQFLTSMIAHHEGALTMAKDELADGTNPEAKKLAQSIMTSQAKEIAEMKQMLQKL